VIGFEKAVDGDDAVVKFIVRGAQQKRIREKSEHDIRLLAELIELYQFFISNNFIIPQNNAIVKLLHTKECPRS
jgi:hypothetical protein